jgi:CRISPR-associated protein Cas2
MFYLVCFDISDNKVRTRIGNYLGAFGNRVQESVFEVEIADTAALRYVQDKLGGWLSEGDDLRFYQVCQSCRQKSVNARHERIAKLPSLVLL